MPVKPCWKGKDDPRPMVPGLPEVIPRARTLNALNAEMRCCTRCPLARSRTQVVTGEGSSRAEVLLIGEAPGAQEDEQGRPFVGRAGELLNRLLEIGGLDRSAVYITNIVACRPPRNRTPNAAEIRAHGPWLDEQIRLIRPRLIVTLGRAALGYFQPKASIAAEHGRVLRLVWQDAELAILPTYHPAATFRRPAVKSLLESDFRRIRDVLRRLSGRPSRRSASSAASRRERTSGAARSKRQPRAARGSRPAKSKGRKGSDRPSRERTR